MDKAYRDVMSNDLSKYYFLKNAFEKCPIPTLIISAVYDPGYNKELNNAFLLNHPGAKMVLFYNSSHKMFQDESAKFMGFFKSFITNLPNIGNNKIKNWQNYLKKWAKGNPNKERII